jgi:hypothetical protein
MRNLYPRTVEILDHRDLKFKCKICGQIWFPSIKSGGRLYRSSWECPSGCKESDLKKEF